MRRLYLVDLSILAHKANAIRLEDKVDRKKGYLGAWVRANLAVLCGLDWDKARDPQFDRPAIVFLSDSKPYWRAKELVKHKIAYKKGRKTRTRKGLSYTKTLLIKEISNIGLPVLGLPGQEADDMASLFCRAKPDDVAIRLVTTDNDWCGLIDPARSIDWYCAHGYLPRHRATLAHVQESRQGKESGIQDLKDFYPLKALQGDKGDNLPPGCPRWAVDILNPLEEHDSLLTPEGQRLAHQAWEHFDRLVRVTQYFGLESPRAKKWLLATQSKAFIH